MKVIAFNGSPHKEGNTFIALNKVLEYMVRFVFSEEIRELIRGLAPAHTVLLSSHLLSEVAKTCSRVVVIHRGRVVADDTLEGLASGGSLEEVFLRLTSDEPAA